MDCIKMTISGRVQGVGFRYGCRKKANELGITGYAKNLKNGDVETLLIGTAQSINNFHSWLKSGGPEFSKITNIEVHTPSENINYEDFITI